MEAFTCAIDGQQYPVALLNEHHIVPKSLGGTDQLSNIAPICSGCHQSLHAIAYMLNNPNRSQEIEATTISLFPRDADARAKMLRFASLVAKEMRMRKETRKDPGEMVRVTMDLPARFLELLRLYGYEMPHKNGKPSGIAAVIRHAITDQLSRKFPLLKNEIQFLGSIKPK
jgi:hypothetical protein